jgi:hypothetical protein
MDHKTRAKHKSKELTALRRLATTTLMRALYGAPQHRIAENDKHRAQVKGATGLATPSNDDIDACFV